MKTFIYALKTKLKTEFSCYFSFCKQLIDKPYVYRTLCIITLKFNFRKMV